jgi:hypothetical protein
MFKMTVDSLAVEAAKNLTTVATSLDYLGLAKNSQMPAHARLADMAHLGELTYTHLLATGQKLHHRKARGVGKAFEMDG